MRIALIENGVVENVIEAGADFLPPAGMTAVPAGDAGPGWLYAGGAFSPAPPPPVTVPESVALWQARAALRAAGLFDASDAAVRASGDPALIEAWDRGNTISRNSQGMEAMGAAIGLTDAQIDALFISAAGLAV